MLAEATLEEQVGLASGADMWHAHGIDRLGVPALKMSDGPAGARGERFTGSASLSFPCGTSLGATFDTDLVRTIGAALGDEARSKGAHVLLAPTVNLHRTPLAGRTFECLSEDPLLAARLAVAYIGGLQGRGVAGCVKHFACNDQEHERMSISARVDERALREIHLPPFEAAVREAGVWSVMSAYNRLDGTFCSEHSRLLGSILREEWGFDGVVVSDWFGTHSTVAAALAGLDLEMPGPAQHFGAALVDAVRRGEVGEAVVEAKAARLLLLLTRTGAFGPAPPTSEERSEDVTERRAVARAAAAAGMVLLRNEGVLPLEPARLGRLAVIGPNADRFEVQGGGSAQVNPHRLASPLEALRRRLPAVEVLHEPGCSIHQDVPTIDIRHLTVPGGGAHGLRVDYFANPDLDGEAVFSEVATRGRLVWLGEPAPGVGAGRFSVRASATLRASRSGRWTFSLSGAWRSRLLLDGAVLVDNWEPEQGSSFFGLGSRPVEAELDLAAEDELELQIELQAVEGVPIAGVVLGALEPEPSDAMERAVAAAATADVALVVVGANSDWETEGADRAHLDLPGAQDELVRRVAAANPRTVVAVNAGSPVRMPWAGAVGAVVMAWYPGEEGAEALADVLLGERNPSGRLPVTFPLRLEDTPAFLHYPGERGEVRYGEEVFVGYRWYDTRAIEPAFCFGHGLSYTSFAYGDLRVDHRHGWDVSVDVAVTNVGERAGAEVIQLYVRDVEASVARPDQELKAFAKVELAPGQRSTVRLALDERSFAFWDVATGGWTAEPGEFELRIGASSRDCRLSTMLRLG